MVNKKRLNLGCGKDYRKGWINLDYNFNCDALYGLPNFFNIFKTALSTKLFTVG